MAEEDYDDVTELESAEYSTKSDFSKAEIVKQQVQRCNEVRSKEMREGYFNSDKYGNKIYIPDSRKEWVSAVITLRRLLTPEILRSSVFDVEKYTKAEKDLIEKWGVENSAGQKVIPMLDEVFLEKKKMLNKSMQSTGAVRSVPKTGLYNSNFHRYWDERVELYDEMFADLNVLIDQNNYFKQGIAY